MIATRNLLTNFPIPSEIQDCFLERNGQYYLRAGYHDRNKGVTLHKEYMCTEIRKNDPKNPFSIEPYMKYLVSIINDDSREVCFILSHDQFTSLFVSKKYIRGWKIMLLESEDLW